MKCIKTLTDEDFGMKNIYVDKPRVRISARGLVFNENKKIAILYKQKKNEYKLVGGGIERDEDPSIAFEREVLEETGCKIEIDGCLGFIIENKFHDNFKQTSYVFVAHVIQDTHILNFTQEELNDGSKLIWLDINDAMSLIKDSEDKIVASTPENVYHTKFIVRRDYEILKYYLHNN